MRDPDGALYGWHLKVEIFLSLLIVACTIKCCLCYIPFNNRPVLGFLQPIFFAAAGVAVKLSTIIGAGALRGNLHAACRGPPRSTRSSSKNNMTSWRSGFSGVRTAAPK
jgi:hypothetical protein